MTTNTFTLEFNVTGAERKRLVNAIATYTQADPKYLGAPSFAYQVDYFTIDKNGCVSFDDRADSQEIEDLIDTLVEQGFPAADRPVFEPTEEVAAEAAEAPTGEKSRGPCQADRLDGERTSSEMSELSPLDGSEQYGACEDALTVAIPLGKVSVGNLTSLLDAKGNLIKKALGITATPIEIGEEAVSFPWFEDGLTPDEVKAYTHFISALCEMSHTLKRVVATEKDVDNEKYAFRCFLLRLGFIGSDYKDERKILLRNLAGSSAFKSGAKRSEEVSA